MKQRLVKSAIKCLTCNTEVESTHRHDFARCQCPSDSDTAISIDGGLMYRRIGYGIKAEFEDISEWEEFE